MLDKPLQFVVDNLDEFFKQRGKITSSEKILVLTNLVDDQGKFAVKLGNVGVTLINIEEERVNKAQMPETVKRAGKVTYFNPELRLNLFLLFVANYSQYIDSVKAISNVISFFQINNVFNSENFPSLDKSIDKIIFDISTKSFEELSYIWGVLGTNYRPSVIYRMRLVTVQEEQLLKSGAEIGSTDYLLGGK